MTRTASTKEQAWVVLVSTTVLSVVASFVFSAGLVRGDEMAHFWAFWAPVFGTFTNLSVCYHLLNRTAPGADRLASSTVCASILLVVLMFGLPVLLVADPATVGGAGLTSIGVMLGSVPLFLAGLPRVPLPAFDDPPLSNGLAPGALDATLDAQHFVFAEKNQLASTAGVWAALGVVGMGCLGLAMDQLVLGLILFGLAMMLLVASWLERWRRRTPVTLILSATHLRMDHHSVLLEAPDLLERLEEWTEGRVEIKDPSAESMMRQVVARRARLRAQRGVDKGDQARMNALLGRPK